MALVVSLAGGITAWQLTRLQTQIAEAQALPQLEVAIHQKMNDVTGKYDDNVLVITNRGGPVHDFGAQAAFFLQVTTTGQGLDQLKGDIPINGYFTMNGLSSGGTGVLATVTGYRNNARVVALAQELREAAQAVHRPFALLNEQCVVRVRYRDLLNRPHETYYEAHPIGGGSLIPDDVGRARLAKWEAGARELSTIKADDLLKSATSLDANRR
jgi:hypothetical protein